MYHLFDNGLEIVIVLIDSDGLVHGIPRDPENTDYQVFLEWVAAGNTASAWNPT